MKTNNGEKKRCFIYVRLSTEDQHRRVEFSSLESQEKVCKAYITSQEPNGWKYITSAKDLCSGGNTDRPGLNGLIESIKQDKVDVVVMISPHNQVQLEVGDSALVLSICLISSSAGVCRAIDRCGLSVL